MPGTTVLATGCGAQQPADVKALALSVRALAETGREAVLLTPGPAGLGPALSLELGESRAGRRAVPLVTHVLVDPLDPALAHPPGTVSPEPLAILEAEAIAAYRLGLDPDNHGIPLVTSSMDLIGAVALIFAILIMRVG